MFHKNHPSETYMFFLKNTLFKGKKSPNWEFSDIHINMMNFPNFKIVSFLPQLLCTCFGFKNEELDSKQGSWGVVEIWRVFVVVTVTRSIYWYLVGMLLNLGLGPLAWHAAKSISWDWVVVKESIAFIAWCQARRMGSSCWKDGFQRRVFKGKVREGPQAVWSAYAQFLYWIVSNVKFQRWLILWFQPFGGLYAWGQ